MTSPDPDVTKTFWRILGRVLGRPITPGSYQRDELPEWDSLRHIELIFELEEAMGLQIDPDAIAELYSSTDALLDYLARHGAAT
jgi:acyl carrier protein